MGATDVVTTVKDGGLGLLSGAGAGVHVKIGSCSGGTVNTLISVADPADVPTKLGFGPLADAVSFCLGTTVNGRRPTSVIAVPVTCSTAGSAGPVVHAGTGTAVGTSSGAAFDTWRVIAKITRAAANLAAATAAMRISLDNGESYGLEVAVPISGVYAIPGTGVTLTFADGTFVVDDTYAFRTRAPMYSTSDLANAITALLADPAVWEFVHFVGAPAPSISAVVEAGTAPPDVTITGTAADYYQIRIEITTGGARGVAVFRYSLDGGTTWVSGITTAATYVIPGTGLTIGFATGTDYATDNVYTADSGNAAGLATLAAAVDTHMGTALTADRFVFGVLESPDDTDAHLSAAMASFSSVRTMAAAGFAELLLSANGRLPKRSEAWPIVARIAAIPISEHPGKYASGPVSGVKTSAAWRDERRTPGLDDARFATLQSYLGVPGAFVTNGRMMAPAGSDFQYVEYRRVMDRACDVGRQALLHFKNTELRVNATTGFILESEAAAIDAYVEGIVRAAVGEHTSSLSVQTIRTDNLLSTQKLRAKIRLVPFAYARAIEMEIGFVNPSLALVAA